MFKVTFNDGSWMKFTAPDIFAALDWANNEFGAEEVKGVEGC